MDVLWSRLERQISSCYTGAWASGNNNIGRLGAARRIVAVNTLDAIFTANVNRSPPHGLHIACRDRLPDIAL